MKKNSMEEIPQTDKSPENNIETSRDAEILNLKGELSRVYRMYASVNEDNAILREQIEAIWPLTGKIDRGVGEFTSEKDNKKRTESARRISAKYLEKSNELNKELEEKKEKTPEEQLKLAIKYLKFIDSIVEDFGQKYSLDKLTQPNEIIACVKELSKDETIWNDLIEKTNKLEDYDLLTDWGGEPIDIREELNQFLKMYS